MQFRCPNCQHGIRVEDSGLTHEDETVDGIECPSCHSHFNLSSDVDTTVAAEKGAKIGHFIIQDVLGEGSFGTVYKANDPELNRVVAIKIPRAGRVSSKTSRLFLREAQSAARVKHSNVVAVYEVGHHEEQYYIASEYIDGISLSEYLKTHSLAPRDSAELLIKVLRGVAAFHKEGIIHRDLKPANILLDDQTEPHITDFGLARHESENAITVTQNGDVFGTPVYMPPEQARGDVHQINQRSDVYAVGVILYQLLTGKKPFKASSSRTLLYSIQHDDPARPRTLDKHIPRELETICLKAIEKDGAARYESASAMADDLQRWLDGHPILARPVNVWKRVSKWVGRHKSLTAALVVAACSLMVAAATSARSREEVPDNMTPVVIQTDPPADWIRFVRHDEMLRRPHSGKFEVTTSPDEMVYLQPGLYRVTAATNQGAYHEVWRTVPELSDVGTVSDAINIPINYPHFHSWRRSDGNVELPAIRLFRERDIEAAVVLEPGGSFQMGTDNQAGGLSGKHQQIVDDFYVGIHEVSYGRFREVMTSFHPTVDTKTTWLDFLDKRFGDRADRDPGLPVTGYPRDVAVLYCELVGGRLPSPVEYEYVATDGGKSPYPTGTAPAIADPANWKIMPVAQPTADQTPSGIQNLYLSVAEYTDSLVFNYGVLYPKQFPKNPYSDALVIALKQASALQLKDHAEVRGAPKDWIREGVASLIGSPRDRIAIAQDVLFATQNRVSPTADQLAAQDTEREALERTGWRVYRSASVSKSAPVPQ